MRERGDFSMPFAPSQGAARTRSNHHASSGSLSPWRRWTSDSRPVGETSYSDFRSFPFLCRRTSVFPLSSALFRLSSVICPLRPRLRFSLQPFCLSPPSHQHSQTIPDKIRYFRLFLNPRPPLPRSSRALTPSANFQRTEPNPTRHRRARSRRSLGEGGRHPRSWP